MTLVLRRPEKAPEGDRRLFRQLSFDPTLGRVETLRDRSKHKDRRGRVRGVNIRRWGSSGWTHGLKRSGRKVGANFGDWKTWPNTLRAHQLIAYVTDPKRCAGNKPTTSECNAAIFDAMYERGENISLVETLVRIATERLGLEESEVSHLTNHLQNNDGAKIVMREIQTGRKRYGIEGVPFFVIGAEDGDKSVGRPYGFSGAQDQSTFCEIFEEMAGRLA